ncbi:capsular biosynthesis protein [Microbulbifer bruguierae]|uniref:Capsular biosynthesis protein n=1 Tax=Microbulbifer bruguierae TaxID=3029061 RepID=A0ABY8NBV5_9GAMM|nr:capsular biosynthesis protein [Microbulbifer bruguierae]WGL16406.1 capsular biosynthesis protein [Microbulbifer bruguierae]
MSGVLFLQGPLGPFFARCARQLSAQGTKTHKINFNGGDRVFGWADEMVDYSGGPAGWPEYLYGYIRRNGIRTVVVYGDCRFYHREARAVCDELGIKFWAFEEGYLRPDFVTMESDGVNAFSPLDWSQRAVKAYRPRGRKSSLHVGPTFWQRAVYASLYYMVTCLTSRHFPSYLHHRPRSCWQEAGCWLRSLYRKGLYKITQRNYTESLVQNHSGEYFLYPLQTADDFQIREHSDFASIEESIQQVMASFTANAQAHELLVIKHHPMDRGFCHYGRLIRKLAHDLKISGRVVYCHDLHLPTLLDHAKGVVTINSTVGISSLLHRVPTVTLGRAMYDMPEMTHQGELDTFWQQPTPVNSALFNAFRTYLYERTQLDGSFYKLMDETVEAAVRRIVIATKVAEASAFESAEERKEDYLAA